MMYSDIYIWDEERGEEGHRSQKLQWCNVVGAVVGAVVLLGVTYYLISLGSLQRLAYVCVTLAGLSIMLCFAGLVFFVSTRPARPSPTTPPHLKPAHHHHDSPPRYRQSWRRAYYTRRSRGDCTPLPRSHDTSTSTTTTLLPPSLHPKSSFSSSSSTSSSHHHPPSSTSSHIPPLNPHSSRVPSLRRPFSLPCFTLFPSPSLPSPFKRRVQPVTDLNCRIFQSRPDTTSLELEDDLPSYQVALEGMDEESIRKLKDDLESGV